MFDWKPGTLKNPIGEPSIIMSSRWWVKLIKKLPERHGIGAGVHRSFGGIVHPPGFPSYAKMVSKNFDGKIPSFDFWMTGGLGSPSWRSPETNLHGRHRSYPDVFIISRAMREERENQWFHGISATKYIYIWFSHMAMGIYECVWNWGIWVPQFMAVGYFWTPASAFSALFVTLNEAFSQLVIFQESPIRRIAEHFLTDESVVVFFFFWWMRSSLLVWFSQNLAPRCDDKTIHQGWIRAAWWSCLAATKTPQ